MTDKEKPNDPSVGPDEIRKHLAPPPQDWTKVLGSFRGRLQRHPSSYEGDPDDDPFMITILTTASEEILPTTSAATGDNLRRDSKNRILSKSDSKALHKIHVAKNMADQKLTVDRATAAVSPIVKRTTRHGPSLARLQRIESEMGPDPVDKIIRANSVKLLVTREDPMTSLNLSDSEVIKRTGSSAGLESIEKLKSYKASDDLRKGSTESIRIPQILSPDFAMSLKDANPKSWITKSVSKMIADKNVVGGEKKRSKSPSGLLEYAQRRLPKWASFIKKTDDDSSHGPETSTFTRQGSYSVPTTDQSSSSGLTSPVAGTSRKQSIINKEQNITKPGECRWFVSDEEQHQIKSESSTYEQCNKLTKAHSFEPKRQSLSESCHPTTKSYSFSFFKGKESRESNKDSKHKGKSLKGNQHTTSKGKKLVYQANTAKTSPDVLHVEHEIRSKSVSPVDSKSTLKEKNKYFCRQKSKDKEPVRKNSITFGNLREKYNIWSKGGCSNRDKAVSAEALENVRLESPAGKSQGEFLVASMRIFLVVSPPASRTQVIYINQCHCNYCRR